MTANFPLGRSKFIYHGDIEDFDDDDWFITPRLRFVWWVSLRRIRDDLLQLVENDSIETSEVVQGLPQFVGSQPLCWWIMMLAHATRLEEAFREDDEVGSAPRCAGEEALAFLAATKDFIEPAIELLGDPELDRQFEELPSIDGEFDGWGDAYGLLHGDTDIAAIFAADVPSELTADMIATANPMLSSYLPELWHIPYLPHPTAFDADIARPPTGDSSRSSFTTCAITPGSQSNAMAATIGAFYDAAGLVEWLDVTEQALGELVNRRQILGCRTTDGYWVYPAFQFTDTGAVIPGVPEVLDVLTERQDAWATALWFVVPSPDLPGGVSAIVWLALGGPIDAAVTEARRSTEQLS